MPSEQQQTVALTSQCCAFIRAAAFLVGYLPNLLSTDATTPMALRCQFGTIAAEESIGITAGGPVATMAAYTRQQHVQCVTNA